MNFKNSIFKETILKGNNVLFPSKNYDKFGIIFFLRIIIFNYPTLVKNLILSTFFLDFIGF